MSSVHIIKLLAFSAHLAAASLSAQPVILKNQLYRFEVSVARVDAPNIVREFRPELTLQITPMNPGYTRRYQRGDYGIAISAGLKGSF